MYKRQESGGAEDAESRREQAEKLRRKRLRALDAFLEGAITQAELRGLTEQYDGRLARLQAQPAAAAGLQEAAERLRAALRRESGRGDAFYRTLLDGMEIRPDGTAALRLQGIPQDVDKRQVSHSVRLTIASWWSRRMIFSSSPWLYFFAWER